MSRWSSPEGWTTELVDRPELHGSTADVWRALAVSRGNAFVTPEWFQSWLEIYGSEATPVVTVSRRPNGEIAGVMPLVAARRGGLDVLRFAGDNLGDVFHPAASSAEEADVAEAGLAAVSDRLGTVGLVLEHVEPDAAWTRRLQGSRERSSSGYRTAVLPFADLGGIDFDGYLAQRSRNFRSQVRRKTRSLVNDHDARFRMSETIDDLDRDLETFFRLHDERWSGRGGSGAVTVRSRAFHRRFAEFALAQGWLRLWTLECGGEPVASWYGWKLGDRYSYYQAGFARSWADRSVGFVLLAHTIRMATEEQVAVYDLLLGDDEYKSRFATAERQVQSFVLTSGWRPEVSLLKLEGRLWRARARLSPELRERVDSIYAKVATATPGRRRR